MLPPFTQISRALLRVLAAAGPTPTPRVAANTPTISEAADTHRFKRIVPTFMKTPSIRSQEDRLPSVGIHGPDLAPVPLPALIVKTGRHRAGSRPFASGAPVP